MGRVENLLPPARGIDRGPAFSPQTHETCTRTRKDGQPCRGIAVKGTGRCVTHGGLNDRPGRRERHAAIHAAYQTFHDARRKLGGSVPAEVRDNPAWKATPGDALGTAERRAALLSAYASRPEDGGRQWRAVLARFGKEN